MNKRIDIFRDFSSAYEGSLYQDVGQWPRATDPSLPARAQAHENHEPALRYLTCATGCREQHNGLLHLQIFALHYPYIPWRRR
jgi:hypothetical protein